MRFDSPVKYYDHDEMESVPERSGVSLDGDRPEGWLAPDGAFFRCWYGSHWNLADAICMQYYGVESPYMPVASDNLYDRNWIAIHKNLIYSKHFRVTSAQVDAFLDILHHTKSPELRRQIQETVQHYDLVGE